MKNVNCLACEDSPQHPNVPCHVCGGIVSAEPDDKMCRQAYDDFYHKIRAEIGYDHWCAIWSFIAKRLAAPVAAQAQRHEFDDCAASPTGKHSGSWFANGDCEYCKAGAQPDAPLFYAQAQPLSHFPSSHWANQVHAHFNQQAQLEKGCKRSHPHENMSPECEALTKAARKANQAAHASDFGQAQPIMPPLTDSMRAVIRNENDVYGDEDALYAALCDAAQAQQPVSGTGGFVEAIVDAVMQVYCSTPVGEAMDYSSIYDAVVAVIDAQPQLSGNPGQLDHLPDTTKMVDALADALSNLEHDNYERSYSGNKNRESDAALIRAALAQQDADKARSREAEEILQQAAKILSEEIIDADQAKALDAKLRTLLSDIDPFWIRWRYVGEKQGWLVKYVARKEET